MGIITDPGYKLYIKGKHVCFEDDKIPKKIYVTIQGIQKGELWTQDQGEPISGEHITEYIGDNTWLKYTEKCYIRVALGQTYSYIDVRTDKAVYCFNGRKYEACKSSWENKYDDPRQFFYAGVAAITSREKTGSVASLGDTLEILGIEPGPKIFAEVRVTEDGGVVHKFCNQKDGTRIHIKLGGT